MPVVDASVVVEMLAFGEHEAAARERLAGGQEPLWAPELLDAEVGQVLRRAVRKGELDPGQGAQAMAELRELPVHRITHELLVGYAWLLRDQVSFYDALYVALAEMLGEPLLTFDARLGRAGVEAEVEVLAQA
jgi:predicted nucleic acid-binding protein